jgi:ferredoxin
MSAPVEIAYQLDPSKSWDVKFIFNGEENTVSVKEDCSMLEASEKIFDVESSCRNGVCTTCAAQVNSLISIVI